MTFEVFQIQAPSGNNADSLVVLQSAGIGRLEIAPSLGFNALRWQAEINNHAMELLYATPTIWQDRIPTRSGIPILFPFPNRIRNGKFRWNNKDFTLPINDPDMKNAIHGFACRHAWRVVEMQANDNCARATGEFHASIDAPEVQALWPADYILRVTYQLSRQGVRIETSITNPDAGSLPFGLGFHPYFSTPPDADHLQVEVPASEYWELDAALPTGRRLPVDAQRDLRKARPFGPLQMDDILTGLLPSPLDHGLRCIGRMLHVGNGFELSVWAAPVFQEVVVFTPPHRQAICIEPYTMVTDAINLQQHGLKAGLIVLGPNQSWHADVELRLSVA